jgi:hypothetical protein
VKIKKPRKCSVCKSTEHRADYHGSKRERHQRESLAPTIEMPPELAMRSMIDANYALYLVSEGAVGEALANCTRALSEVRRVGLGTGTGDAMLIGLAELEKRSHDIPPELLSQVRELRRKRDEASAAHAAIATKIIDQLGYPARKP